jgi:hypothetical protein
MYGDSGVVNVKATVRYQDGRVGTMETIVKIASLTEL